MHCNVRKTFEERLKERFNSQKFGFTLIANLFVDRTNSQMSTQRFDRVRLLLPKICTVLEWWAAVFQRAPRTTFRLGISDASLLVSCESLKTVIVL